MIDLNGATAVVTGGGNGIGRALVDELARCGCTVVVADIDGDAAAEAADLARERGVQALAVTVDVADAAQVAELAARTYDLSDTVEVVFNNAGVLEWGGMRDLSADDWARVLGVNLAGVLNGVRAFLPRMLAQGSPAHIVNTASYAGFGGRSALMAYSASKAAVVSISEALREELADTSVGVSVLCPANIETRMGRGSSSAAQSSSERGLDPVHVARAAIDAVQRDAFYVFTYPAHWRERMLESIDRRHDEIIAAIERGGTEMT